MKKRNYRKFNLDVPLQPIHNQQPWLIAGFLFAIIILLMIVHAYLIYKGVL
jgi:hypothetical protein